MYIYESLYFTFMSHVPCPWLPGGSRERGKFLSMLVIIKIITGVSIMNGKLIIYGL